MINTTYVISSHVDQQSPLLLQALIPKPLQLQATLTMQL